MTKEECKKLLLDKISAVGGARADELVAWHGFYRIPGFSEIFHPDFLQQMVTEGMIIEVKYTLPDSNSSFSFLLPKETKVSIIGL
jgi:hypothetical protein